MQVVEGYVENGQFFPIDHIACLQGRRRAIITILDEPSREETIAEQLSAMHEMDRLIDSSADEELPEFTRLHFGRELLEFFDEE